MHVYSPLTAPIMIFRFKALRLIAIAAVCIGQIASAGDANRLTAKEERNGWKLLFDGDDLAGYRIYGDASAPIIRWHIDGDAMCLTERINGDKSKVDLVITEEPVGDFEFSFEWKIALGGNSGIFYKVIEGKAYPKPWHTGLEMQLLDDAGHEEGQIDTHRAGDLYDLLAARKRLAKPAGEWNTSRIISKGNRVEQWLNGEKALSFEIGSAQWKRLVADSKYATLSEFAKAKKGHIVI